MGKTAIDVDDEDEEEDYFSNSDWVLVSSDAASSATRLSSRPASNPRASAPNLRPWTDDYSNLFQILKLRNHESDRAYEYAALQ